MCFHVHEVSGLSQTSFVPFLPQDPSGSAKYPDGLCSARYCEQEINLTGESSRANCSAMFFNHSTPSNHQCPKSSASNGDVSTGGAPLVERFSSESRTIEAKFSAWPRVRSSACCG